MMILDSKAIPYEVIDISEPGKEEERDYMHGYSLPKEGQTKSLPPQVFVDNVYVGVSIISFKIVSKPRC